MSNLKQLFWVFSDSKGAGSRKGEEKRWGMTLGIGRSAMSELNWTDGPISLPEPLIGEAERAADIEDVPWVMNSVIVVAPRTKDIFVEAGPNDCQWFPVEVRHNGRPLGLTYWAMHCLHTIDCADHDASYKATSPPLMYIRAAIIPERVPTEISTFRVAHAMSGPIIRDALRRALKKAKVTGCMFYLP